MTLIRRPLALLTLLSAALTLASKTAAETYDIRFFSPKRTGDRYWFQDQRTIENSRIILKNGNLSGSEKTETQTDFEAEVTVIRNNATGKAIEERFKVIRFFIAENETESVEMLPPGTEFYGSLELGKKHFTRLDGQDLPAKATQYLSQLISLRDNSVTDQDIFGSESPVKIEQSWPVDGDMAAEDFNFDMSIRVRGEHIEGECTLLDVTEYDGEEFAHVRSWINVTNALLPESLGARTYKGDISLNTEVWLPKQGPVYIREQRMDMTTTFIAAPLKEPNQFTTTRIMMTSKVKGLVRSKPLPRDESVTELDRTLGIRR